ncbi:fumarylacetoacetate hydrolase family protein [Lichenicoccus sp.]|uniref:fumarylacetoacetate hydrolase family protein n=1 Tax=Lichenicoccus sp. TaxID=2781899 RepID=UPI003D0D63B5
MRLAMFSRDGHVGIAASSDGERFHGLLDDHADYPGDLDRLVTTGTALDAVARLLLTHAPVDLEGAELLPPLRRSGKIICIGLNYADHATESRAATADYPTVFGRFTCSLIGHRAPIIRPRLSSKLDYEGEFVAVIGRKGRHIARTDALDHVVGYTLFNDASVRDYQLRTSQWTVGKNFDGTGAFGPYLVTAADLPPGCAGLRLRTRLNGETVQDASTSDLLFDVATLIALLSEAFTLVPGDLIVTGTPAGVGAAREPPLFMKAGDICEVEMDGLGVLQNPIIDEIGVAEERVG